MSVADLDSEPLAIENTLNNLDNLKKQITPKLVEKGGGREFDPIAVTRLGGTLPFETDSMQLQCGETITENGGDMNIRLVMECVCTYGELEKLQQMRSNPDNIKLVSNSYTGPATFDELKFDRIPDANGAVVRGEGVSNEPLYTVQLQSKEDSENNILGGE